MYFIPFADKSTYHAKILGIASYMYVYTMYLMMLARFAPDKSMIQQQCNSNAGVSSNLAPLSLLRTTSHGVVE